MLIEIGDNQYSFVHLTFQEYLTASYIITDTERHGTEGIWGVIKDHCNDAKWHEVIRLLVASLRSEDSQEFIVEKILSQRSDASEENRSFLLGGLLIDGIESANLHKKEIFEQLLISANSMSDVEQLKHLLSMLRLYLRKDEQNEELMYLAFKSVWDKCDVDKKLSLALIASSLNFPDNKLIELTGNFLNEECRHLVLFKLFLIEEETTPENLKLFNERVEFLWATLDWLLFTSHYTTFVTAITQSVTFPLGPEITAKRIFEEEMISLSCSVSGPFTYINFYSLLFFSNGKSNLDLEKVKSLLGGRIADKLLNLFEQLTIIRDQALNIDPKLNSKKTQESVSKKDISVSWALANLVDKASNSHMTSDYRISEQYIIKSPILEMIKAVCWDKNAISSQKDKNRLKKNKRSQKDVKTQELKKIHNRENMSLRTLDHFLLERISINLYKQLLTTPSLHSPILDFMCFVFDLRPWAQWQEALRVVFLSQISNSDNIFNDSMLKKLEDAFKEASIGETAIYNAASSLIFDSWLLLVGYYESPFDSVFAQLAQLTRELDAAPLKISHCIRDIAYGDEKRKDDLLSMIKSDDPEYRSIFEKCFWIATSKNREI